MSLLEEFRQRAGRVQDRLERACRDAGREPGSVRIVAVSKRHPAGAIDAALTAGFVDFGENYVQEAVDKFPRPGARLHFIGSLQRNKVRRILPLVHLLHGVGSLSVAQAVERIAGEEGLASRFLLQLHLTGEPTKNGLLAEELDPVLDACAGFRHARLVGFMAMAPMEGGATSARPVFEAARELFDRHQSAFGMDTLSMGMSDDLEVAVACGTTHLRVGTALFGDRVHAGAAA